MHIILGKTVGHLLGTPNTKKFYAMLSFKDMCVCETLQSGSSTYPQPLHSNANPCNGNMTRVILSKI